MQNRNITLKNSEISSTQSKYTLESLEEKIKSFDLCYPYTEEEFEDGLNSVLSHLLWDTPQWKDVILNGRALKSVPDLFDIPLVCKAKDCEYVDKCPIIKAMKPHERDTLVGTSCRVEKDYAVGLFTDVIKSTQVAPEDTVDLMNVVEYVRLHIYKRRIDLKISIAGGLYENVFAGIIQKSGQVVTQKAPTQLLNLSAQLNKQIEVLQKQLMANRKEKFTFLKDTTQGSKSMQEILLQKLNNVK